MPIVEHNIPNKFNYFVASKVMCWARIVTAISDNGSRTFSQWLPLGNLADGGNLTPELTRLEHKTNKLGLDARDRNVVIESNADINLVLDELVGFSLELLMGSSGKSNVTVSIPRWVRASFTSGDTITLPEGADVNEVIAVAPLAGDNYEEGASADFTVNLSTGVITRVDSGTIEEEQTVLVFYTTAESAIAYPLFDRPNKNGQLWLTSLGGDLGNKEGIFFPDVDFALDGDINFLPKTEWRQATLQASMNQDDELGYGTWYKFGSLPGAVL